MAAISTRGRSEKSTRSPEDSEKSPTRTAKSAVPTLWELAFILGAAAFAPAMIVVNNPESPGPGTAGLTVLVFAALALMVRAFLIRSGASPVGAGNAAGTAVLVLTNAGFVVESVSMGRWLVFAFAGVAGWVIYRFRDLWIVETAVTAGTFILILTPIVTWIGNWDDSVIGAPVDDIGLVPFVATPDVVVIVTDGYASNRVLDEFYSYDNVDFTEYLNSMGFQVGHSMTSNYGRTALSVPSFLQFGYVLENSVVGRSARRAMFDALSGNNHLVDVMRSNGYRTVYVESGWLGTGCATSIDVCVRGPWPNETLYDIVHRSVLRGLRGFEAGMSFARGSLHSMDWLDDDLASYLGNGEPEFIYVHILAPHPPMFLDASCRLDANPEVAGFAVGMPGHSELELETRRVGYVEQVKCVNEHLERAANQAAAAGAVALMFGDHGPDQGSQMYGDGDEWTAEQRRERFGILFAVLHPGCDYSDLVSLVNVSRRVISCLSQTEIQDLPDRYFDLSRSEGEPRIVELVDAG